MLPNIVWLAVMMSGTQPPSAPPDGYKKGGVPFGIPLFPHSGSNQHLSHNFPGQPENSARHNAAPAFRFTLTLEFHRQHRTEGPRIGDRQSYVKTTCHGILRRFMFIHLGPLSIKSVWSAPCLQFCQPCEFLTKNGRQDAWRPFGLSDPSAK